MHFTSILDPPERNVLWLGNLAQNFLLCQQHSCLSLVVSSSCPTGRYAPKIALRMSCPFLSSLIGLGVSDATYSDPLGPAAERPKTAARRRDVEDEFDNEELGDDLLPE